MGEITFKAKDKVIKLLIGIVSYINRGCKYITFDDGGSGYIIPKPYKAEITNLKYDNDKDILRISKKRDKLFRMDLLGELKE